MERRSVRRLVSIGVGLAATGVLPAFGGGNAPPRAEIDHLDAAIQARFQITDNRRFGIGGRIPLKHPAAHQMEPQTHEEKAVFRSLTEEGWNTALYAARPPRIQHLDARGQPGKPGNSKSAVGSSTQVEVEGSTFAFRSLPEGKPADPLLVMVGPVQITGRMTKAPRLTVNEEGVKKLLAKAMSGKEATLRLDQWQVVARPVRAGKEACVSCHAKEFNQKVRVGDPLGVAIYAFSAEE